MFMSGKEYDAWKKKCAREKIEREAQRRMRESGVARKRTYPFEEEDNETISQSASTGTYITLPTVPPIRVLVHMEAKTVAEPGKWQISESSSTSTARPLPDCQSQRPNGHQPSIIISPTLTIEHPSPPVSPGLPPPPPLGPSTHSSSALLPSDILQSMSASPLLDRLHNCLPLFRLVQKQANIPLCSDALYVNRNE